MTYRYGDATPFPLDENFLETLTAAVDACAALFRADVEAEGRRARAEEARRRAEQELEQLEALGSSVETAVSPLLPAEAQKPQRGAGAVAARVARQTAQAIKQERARMKKRRDTAVRVALGHELPALIRGAVEGFFIRHELPRTRWSVSWRCPPGGRASAAIEAHMPHEIGARFGAAIREGGPWSGPIRVGSLIPRLEVALPGAKGKAAKVALHRYHLVEVELTPQREAMVLSRSPRKPKGGYHLLLRGGEFSTPVVTPLSRRGEPAGDSLPMAGEVVNALWSRVEGGLRTLIRMRSSLESAHLGDRPIEELDSPAGLAEAILNAISPVVREIRIRSRVPGQIILKRDLEGGKREELYVPREALQRKYADLPEKHRRYFEAVGLGADSTVEFARRDLPLEAGPDSVSSMPPPPERAPGEETPTEPVRRLEEDDLDGPSGESAA